MINIRSLRGNNRLILVFPLVALFSCSRAPEKHIPKTDTVVIAAMKFQPAVLTLHKGDSVVWINKDMVAHDITQVPSNTWTSSSLPPGKSWKMAVEESDDYYCSIHIVMVGKLIVK
ncbi:MAG TPA: plastocyanin/azurin family copper-binding protein, partial [Puia sp.]